MNRRVSFESWMRAVDTVIASKLGGLTSRDLPDQCYRDWYDDGLGTVAAAKRAINSGDDE